MPEYCTCFRNIKYVKALMISLDACGKTTLLYNAKLQHQLTTIPTIGFNAEVIDLDRMSL